MSNSNPSIPLVEPIISDTPYAAYKSPLGTSRPPVQKINGFVVPKSVAPKQTRSNLARQVTKQEQASPPLSTIADRKKEFEKRQELAKQRYDRMQKDAEYRRVLGKQYEFEHDGMSYSLHASDQTFNQSVLDDDFMREKLTQPSSALELLEYLVQMKNNAQ